MERVAYEGGLWCSMKMVYEEALLRWSMKMVYEDGLWGGSMRMIWEKFIQKSWERFIHELKAKLQNYTEVARQKSGLNTARACWTRAKKSGKNVVTVRKVQTIQFVANRRFRIEIQRNPKDAALRTGHRKRWSFEKSTLKRAAWRRNARLSGMRSECKLPNCSNQTPANAVWMKSVKTRLCAAISHQANFKTPTLFDQRSVRECERVLKRSMVAEWDGPCAAYAQRRDRWRMRGA